MLKDPWAVRYVSGDMLKTETASNTELVMYYKRNKILNELKEFDERVI